MKTSPVQSQERRRRDGATQGRRGALMPYDVILRKTERVKEAISTLRTYRQKEAKNVLDDKRQQNKDVGNENAWQKDRGSRPLTPLQDSV